MTTRDAPVGSERPVRGLAAGMAAGTTRPYQVCVSCVMDTTDPDIVFDERGVCHHCRELTELRRRSTAALGDPEALGGIVARIRAEGRGKKYDCIVGLSGGVDSTYAAYKAREVGLRPLAVHFDNGWDSELAVKNIENIVKRLDIDLYTYVMDWEEFKDLQLAFLRASVPDGEIPSDHGIAATLLKAACDHGVGYVVTGSNANTEGILPIRYSYGALDWRYIRSVHRLYGRRPLETFPHYGLLRRCYYVFVRRLRMVPILDYLPYDKAEAMKVIERDLGWRYYGGKHYESIYTRFYQAYVLPRKFNVDKRRAHFSTLIVSGQMSREEALRELEKDPYPADLLEEDRDYVVKKLGLTEAAFDEIMRQPVRSFLAYPSYYPLLRRLDGLRRTAKAWHLLPQRVGI